MEKKNIFKNINLFSRKSERHNFEMLGINVLKYDCVHVCIYFTYTHLRI